MNPTGIGQDRLVEAGHGEFAHRRIERREQQVLRHDVGAGEPVEQRRLAGIGVADQSDHRPRRTLPPRTMQGASPRYLLQLPAQLRHPIADQPPVGLDLGFAGAAEKPEATALTLEVSPASHKATGLVIEMGELDLQPPFRGRGALAEYFEDQAGAVDHLGLDRGLEVALLDGRDRGIDDDQFRVGLRRRLPDRFHLPRSEQGRGLGRADPESELFLDLHADRFGKTGGLVEPRFGTAPAVTGKLGKRDDRLCAPRYLTIVIPFETAQLPDSSSSDSIKLTGCSGCTVEMACL
jgi:hypothetical protein